MRNKKEKGFKGLVTGIIVTLIFILIAGCIMGSNKNKELIFTDEIIAYVNLEPIYLDEFKEVLMNEELAKTYMYFGKKYGVEDYTHFFEMNFDKEDPLTFIKENALERCIAIKAEQVMAKEAGVWDDISYPKFLDAYKAENTKRQEALEKGEVVYGLTEYISYEYYQYLLANKREQLKGALQKKWNISKNELQKYYEKTKDNYQLDDEVTIEMLFIQVNPSNIERIAGEMNTMCEQLQEEEGLESLVKRWMKEVEKPLYSTYTFKPENEKLDYKRYEPIKIRIKDMERGEVSPLIQNRDQLVFYRIIDKKVSGYLTFEEVEQEIKKDYFDDQYDILLNKNIEQSKVVINTELYDAFHIER